MKFTYNSDYFPPAPQSEFRYGAPDESLKVGPLRAFVDSGADRTLVPAHYVYSLQLEIYDDKFLLSHLGDRKMVTTYRLDVGIGNLRLPSIEVVADEDSDEIIIGRNILNMLRVFMDGPKQIVEISE